ncbi:MAG: glutathione peroxidase [Spirosomaceae bacterium]|jgi:glutathione peroxidase|nr:glutathione peroxidase [Spirosomataceae bacterium]
MKKAIFITIGAILITTLAMGLNIMKMFSDKKEIRTMPTDAVAKASIYDFKIKSLDGKQTISLAQYQGKKIVILNVASKCGFTPQYADWEAFYKKNKDKVVVLGFPANDFMMQEPGNNSEIAEFCHKNYGVTFQMFDKVEVTGKNKHPLYKWLSDKSLNGWNDQEPSWNFCKYVVDEKGNLVSFFASDIKPNNPEFIKAISK